jgi:spore coat protein A
MAKKTERICGMPMTRRQILKMGAVGGAGLLLPMGLGSRLAFAEHTDSLEMFEDPLPRPGTFDTSSGAITVGMKQVTQQVHSAIGPVTTLWGYGNKDIGFGSPGPTFDVESGEPIEVTWVNMLADDPDEPHFLDIDPAIIRAIHGAEDNRKAVVHLHGAKKLTQFSDGFPEDKFAPGASATYQYPNAQEAANLWYHDHAVGNTRLNVMMGLAGFYLIRDDNERALSLPRGNTKPRGNTEPSDPFTGIYEIPLAIQDRRIKDNGQLSYDRMFDDTFFGDVPVLNGVAYPHLKVEPRKYRFRLLNGSNSRSYTLHIGDNRYTPEAGLMLQIGTDSGFLDAPVPLERITLTPGERADVIIDFSKFDVGDEPVLFNSRPSRPMEETDEYPIAELMQFRVGPLMSTDTPPVPEDLDLRPLSGPANPLDVTDADGERSFKLEDVDDPAVGDSKWLINGVGFAADVDIFDQGGDPEVTVKNGDVEIWEWVNKSSMVHPMHIHLVSFQVLSRKLKAEEGGWVDVGIDDNEMGPKDTVRVGPKERVRVLAKFEGDPGVNGDELFPFHCHILEHEDHDMMRAFKLVK